MGAGIDLSQPKALSPEAVTSWKWPRGSVSGGRQGKSRDKLTRTQDEENGINSAPANTKAGGCTERGSQGRSALCQPARTLAFINNSACWVTSTTAEGPQLEGAFLPKQRKHQQWVGGHP